MIFSKQFVIEMFKLEYESNMTIGTIIRGGDYMTKIFTAYTVDLYSGSLPTGEEVTGTLLATGTKLNNDFPENMFEDIDFHVINDGRFGYVKIDNGKGSYLLSNEVTFSNGEYIHINIPFGMSGGILVGEDFCPDTPDSVNIVGMSGPYGNFRSAYVSIKIEEQQRNTPERTIINHIGLL